MWSTFSLPIPTIRSWKILFFLAYESLSMCWFSYGNFDFNPEGVGVMSLKFVYVLEYLERKKFYILIDITVYLYKKSLSFKISTILFQAKNLRKTNCWRYPFILQCKFPPPQLLSEISPYATLAAYSPKVAFIFFATLASLTSLGCKPCKPFRPWKVYKVRKLCWGL